MRSSEATEARNDDVGWSGPSVGLATVGLECGRCAMGARPRRARARRIHYSPDFSSPNRVRGRGLLAAPSVVCGKWASAAPGYAALLCCVVLMA